MIAKLVICDGNTNNIPDYLSLASFNKQCIETGNVNAGVTHIKLQSKLIYLRTHMEYFMCMEAKMALLMSMSE